MNIIPNIMKNKHVISCVNCEANRTHTVKNTCTEILDLESHFLAETSVTKNRERLPMTARLHTVQTPIRSTQLPMRSSHGLNSSGSGVQCS